MEPLKPRLYLSYAAISPQILTYFSAQSWALDICRNPSLFSYESTNLVPKASTHDSLVAETLATHNAIRAWQAFYLPLPLPNSPPTNAADKSELLEPKNLPLTSPKTSLSGEFWTLISLGSGLNGQANLLHGGMISFLFDECMRICIQAVLGAEYSPAELLALGEAGPMGFTARLTTNFRAPVKTPGVVLCKIWIERTEGRKSWLSGVMMGGEEGAVILGDAEGLFIVGKKGAKL